MRILFFISTLRAGGAERVASILCNAWVKSGHEVTVCTLQPAQEPSHYPLASEIELLRLGLMRDSHGLASVIAGNTRRIRELRSVLKQTRPDVLCAFMMEGNVLAVLSAAGLDIPVVISERTHPGHHPVAQPYALARKLAYSWADRLVAQSRTVADWCHNAFDLRHPPVVIPNPIDRNAFYPAPSGREQFPRRTLASVGRLGQEKGMDVLIDAFARLAPRFANWDFEIHGEGTEREALQARIDEFGLGERISLRGETHDVASVLRSADLFALASRYEGFPNAVIEALACGRCVVTSDAPGAAREILGQGRYGVLVPVDDIAAWSDALAGLMGDDAKRCHYERQAEQAVSALSAPEVANRWLELFQSLRH